MKGRDVVRFLADEHVPRRLIAALRARVPEVDVVRVQDVGLAEADDLLARAAAEDRAVITADRNTLVGFAYDRVRAGELMTGVVVVDDQPAIGPTVDDLEVIAVCSHDGELHGQIVYLPLR